MTHASRIHNLQVYDSFKCEVHAPAVFKVLYSKACTSYGATEAAVKSCRSST